MNISVYNCFITQAYWDEILKNEPVLKDCLNQEYKMKIKAGESTQDFEEKITAVLSKEAAELSGYSNIGMNWESMCGGVTMFSNIAMSIILVFSLLLILIALIIIRFSIHNFIEGNLKNIGIMQASGYTSKELIMGSLAEMLFVSLCGITVGLICGYLCSKPVGNLEAMMMGLSWAQPFNVTTAGITAVLVAAIVVGTTYFTSRVYKKISVLDALRGGIYTHNFRKNYFPLDKTKMSQPLVLAGKSIMNEKFKTITVISIILFLSFTTYVGFFLYQNFAYDTDNLLRLTGIEAGDVMINGSDLERVDKNLTEWQEVEKVLSYAGGSAKISNGDSTMTAAYDMWSDPKQLENETVIEGRLPIYDNEIVLTTSVAQRLNAGVGDIIYIEGVGEKKDFMVSGIDQKINNMGRKALMHIDALTRLNGQSQVMALYVYLKAVIHLRILMKSLLPIIQIQMSSRLWTVQNK